MGKYALFLVLASALGLAFATQQSHKMARNANEDQTERQGTVIARQIARSAFEQGMSTVKRNFDTVLLGTQEGSYEQGTYVLTLDTTSSGGTRVVTITAEGTYRSDTYRITAKAHRDTSVSALFHAITASTPIDFNVAGGGCSGAPCVSGLDVGGREDRHGIMLPNGSDPEAVCDEFDGKVEGRAEGCDVKARSAAEDDWVEKNVDAVETEIKTAIDAGSDDVTVCANNCKVKDLPVSSGILYVTGELRFDGEREWDGLVFVAEDGEVRINGGGDARNIDGGLLLQENTVYSEDEEFDMNGGNAVQYNTSNLLPYVGTLPSIRTTSIQITDRTGKLLHP